MTPGSVFKTAYRCHQHVGDERRVVFAVRRRDIRHLQEGLPAHGRSLAQGSAALAFGYSALRRLTMSLGVRDNHGGAYNGVLLRYADYVSSLSNANGFGVVDENAPFVDVLTKANAANSAVASQIIGDHIHPGWQGDYVMAEQIIKSWHGRRWLPPSPSMSRAATSIRRTPALPIFTQAVGSRGRDRRSLPLPVDRNDPIMKLVLASSDFDASVDEEPLTIRGLPAGQIT